MPPESICATWPPERRLRIAADAGIDDAEAAARRLMMLRDGAMVNGYLGEPGSLAVSLSAAFDSVIAAAE